MATHNKHHFVPAFLLRSWQSPPDEKLTQFEWILRPSGAHLSNSVQNLRLTYDRTCDIIFRLIERALGLGPQEVSGEMVHQWVREAMEQTGGY